MKIKVSEASGPALDWLVWEIAGGPAAYPKMVGANFLRAWNGNSTKYLHPSTDWSQGGPIIERERLSPQWNELWKQWTIPDRRNAAFSFMGPTFLIAAMRCFVASKLGDEVEVPDELAS